jgi:hypothetical protein
VGRKYTELSEHETWTRGRQMIGMNRAQRKMKLRQEEEEEERRNVKI